MVRQRIAERAAPARPARHAAKAAARRRIDDCEVCLTPVSDGRHIVSALRLAGHAVTPPREVVIRAVAAQPRPFTAGAICAAVTAIDPSVGRATVFRTLELLEEAGALDRLHAVRGDASYVARDPERPDRPHQYLVCTVCDGVTELEDPRLAPLLRSAAAARAFRPEGALVEILGRCQAC
jgi:Fur family ferric uptake transcriptional regulator